LIRRGRVRAGEGAAPACGWPWGWPASALRGGLTNSLCRALGGALLFPSAACCRRLPGDQHEAGQNDGEMVLRLSVIFRSRHSIRFAAHRLITRFTKLGHEVSWAAVEAVERRAEIVDMVAKIAVQRPHAGRRST